MYLTTVIYSFKYFQFHKRLKYRQKQSFFYGAFTCLAFNRIIAYVLVSLKIPEHQITLNN